MKLAHLLRPLVAALVVLVPTLVTGASSTASAKELETLQKTLQERFPTMKIVDIKPSPVDGIYEVFMGTSVAYADKTGEYLLSGSLIQTSTKTNLTSERVNERNAIKFDTLPFDQAIKMVKGDGSRKLAIFTDPDCPFCKKLEEELKSVNNVTVYVFLFPLKIHPQAERRSKAIWCSADRAQAWTQWVLEQKEPEGSCADDPISSTLALGQKLNVSGTPTLYFEDGKRAVGAIPAATLETTMTAAKASASTGCSDPATQSAGSSERFAFGSTTCRAN